MHSYRLFSLLQSEANLLIRAIGVAVSSSDSEGKPMKLPEHDIRELRDLSARLHTGGFFAFVGSVTDPDGDSAWKLTASFRAARAWADDMALACYDTPKAYWVEITSSGFGEARRLKIKPDHRRSRYFTD